MMDFCVKDDAFLKKADMMRRVFPEDPVLLHVETAEKAYAGGDHPLAISLISEAIADVISSNRDRTVLNPLNELLGLLKKR